MGVRSSVCSTWKLSVQRLERCPEPGQRAPVHCTCGASTTLGGGASWCRSVLESTSDLPDLLIHLFLSEAGDLSTSTDGDHQINIASMLWFYDVTAGNICVNVNYFTDREMRD